MAYGFVNVKSPNSSNGSGVFLADVQAASAVSGNGQINLKWEDPSNVVVASTTVATWVGTLVVRKAGEVPADRNDGIVVTNNTTKDAYKTTAFVDTGLTNGVVYYYKFFPYSSDGNYTSGTSVSGKPGATSVPIPTITSTHTYDGNAQTPTLSNFDGTIMSKYGNLTETSANESSSNPYIITVELISDDVIWADGTYEPKELIWNMAKANNVPILSASYGSVGVTQSITFTVTAAGTGKLSAESTNNAVATALCPNNAANATVTVNGVGKGAAAIIVTVDEDDNYKSGSAYYGITVTRYQVPIPIVTNTSKTYNGSYQSPTITNEPSSTYATKSGNYNERDASTASGNVYTFTYTLTDTNLYEWEDGNISPLSFNWVLAQKTGTVTLSSSTLSISSLSGEGVGTITIGGEGDGGVTVNSNTNPSIVSTAVNGTSTQLTCTKSGSASGTATLTLSRAATRNYTASTNAQVIVTVSHYKKMTVTINQSNSNPSSCCTYADDAASMTAGSADWDTFFGEYPCLMAGGVEGVKLNPNNYAQNINGTAVTIDSGNNDVMVAFPRRGLKISTSGDVITISMTDAPNDPNYEYMAHKRGSTLKDKFYIGAYMGSEVSSKLRSLKGKTIANNKTIGAFRTLAQANGAPNGNGGSGYDLHGWYQVIYLQAMFVLKYKTLNSQSAVGQGYTNSSNTAQKSTGGTETWGLTKTGTSNTDHMKCFGIEDLWGNVWSWIDGIFSDSSRNMLTATQGFNDTGSGYTNNGAASSSNLSGWLSKAQGGTHTGFIAKAVSGSETTYYCDHSAWYASCVARLGGDWDSGSNAGLFYLHVNSGASNAHANVGSRLMFL